MKYDEFIGQVQNRARLSSRGEAERVTKATLQTLGERLGGGEAKDVASQLPPQLADYTLSGLAGLGAPFSVQEFFQLVSDREGADFQKAAFHTRVVLEVLQEAVTRGEIFDICAQLPTEYQRLFEAGNQGQI